MSQSAIDAIRKAAPAILPSLLLCDFGDLKSEIQRLDAAGSKVLHLDVMDGHFVPNLTYGMPIVEGVRKHTQMPIDVHLMISEPLKYAQSFVDAGADLLTFTSKQFVMRQRQLSDCATLVLASVWLSIPALLWSRWIPVYSFVTLRW